VPLSDWLPEYDVNERHERFIAATPERALELALRAPAAPDPIVRALFRLRGVVHTRTIEELAQWLGFAERERTSTSWVVAGGGSVRIGLDFVARPEGGGTILSTETRVQALTPRARLAFRLYWLVVGPFSALVRRRWLRAIARSASLSDMTGV
jgi:hypothetical protein